MVLTLFKEGSKVLSVALYKTLVDILSTNQMTKDEALKILQVSDQQDKSEIYKKYKNLYDRNENKSKYLQSKIKNAYEFLTK
ncbi:uncharacterized protein VNE69_01192 [Vairimorpha necatrix]|uniref:Mitochondrial import inner membrane translocase subunit TIM16 n=1 Tax=Vairimorpha necatrix TaxID=6039 RepID=A0AAX4J8H3_9MICR